MLILLWRTNFNEIGLAFKSQSLITRFMGTTWDPHGGGRTQVDPMLAPWTLQSGVWIVNFRQFWSGLNVDKSNRKYPTCIFPLAFLSSKYSVLQCLLYQHTENGTTRPPFRKQQNAFSWLKIMVFSKYVQSSLEFIPKGPINNKTAFTRVTVWYQTSDKPLFV